MVRENKIKQVEEMPDETEPLAPISKRETIRAQHALRDYAFMTHRRSLRNLTLKYKQDKLAGLKPPTDSFVTLSQWSMMFKWVERVAIWDEIERKREEADFIENQTKWRLRRKEIVQGAFAKIAQALQNVDVSSATVRDISGAIKIINQELRLEYKDDQATSDGITVNNPNGSQTIINIIQPKMDDDE